MFLKRCLSSFAVLALTSVAASALTLECKVKKSSAGGGYLTEVYYFDYDGQGDKALVSDALIYYYNDEQPLTAKVSEDTARKLVFSWNVQMTNQTGQMTKMQFRGSYFKAEKTFTVRAVPGGGYTNNFESRGTCKSV
jgi:hypothetical protein